MLLLVVLDYVASTYFRLVRIIPKFAECPALAQEIPVLVKLDFQLTQATPVIVCQFAPPIQAFLLLHQAINVIEYRLIFFLDGHESSFLMTTRIVLGQRALARRLKAEGQELDAHIRELRQKRIPRPRFSPKSAVKVSLKWKNSITNTVIRPVRVEITRPYR